MASAVTIVPPSIPNIKSSVPTARHTSSVLFDPKAHLCYEKPSVTITLDDLGLNPPESSSRIAITAPFPLLTPAGVRDLRASIFNHEIVGKYGSWKYPGVYRIRGYGPAAPFAYSMWRSDEILRACSDAAGVELDIIMDYEIGQLNVQLPKGITKSDVITENLPAAAPPKAPSDDVDELEEGEDLKDLVSAWHQDSYPWVCVLMLSDSVGMSGGETALRKGDGGILKMRQPGMGYAVMMQGSVVSHAALRTLGSGERITFVVSMKARDPLSADTSTLRTVKPISNNDELFRQWAEYRLKVVAERVKWLQQEIQTKHTSAEETHKITQEWAEEQIGYIRRTADEMDLATFIAPNYK